MSGIVYPSGPQQLKIPTTILLPSVATPFNPSAVNPGTEACWDGVKTLESYGFYKTTFDAAQPPYPAGGLYYNTGTYALLGTLMILNTSGESIKFPVAHEYERVAHLHAYSDPAFWSPGHTNVPAKGYYQSLTTDSSSSGIVFDFDLPSNCTVTGVRIRITPVVHGALPATMPKFDVFLLDVAAGTSTLVASVTDPSTLPQYNVLHVFGVTFTQAIDASKNRIMVKFYGEGGANGASGLLVHIPAATYTRDQIGEEFGELVP